MSNSGENGTYCIHALSMGGSRNGERGPATPLENHKNIGFLSNTGQENQASIQFWAIIGPPANCHLNGISLAGH